MYIEWAVGCADARRREGGWDVTGLGETGFVAGEHQISSPFTVPVLVCLRVEPGDDDAQDYDSRVAVTGPSGPQEVHTGCFKSLPDASPGLVEPRRCYEALAVSLNVGQTGRYLVTLIDASGERAVIPYYFSVFPEK